MKRVNYCGVPEESFQDGKCAVCGKSVCDMDDSRLVDVRVYNWARKHFIIRGDMLFPYSFLQYFEEKGDLEKAPKYIQKYVQQLREQEK